MTAMFRTRQLERITLGSYRSEHGSPIPRRGHRLPPTASTLNIRTEPVTMVRRTVTASFWRGKTETLRSGGPGADQTRGLGSWGSTWPANTDDIQEPGCFVVIVSGGTVPVSQPRDGINRAVSR
ncbi:hypothetical protein PSCLAVI8L_90130 [Pseudoclavibacter sp. 8L]|nr:hypothetical protein PSCLAVI8L_90130 [Pseudoclavibacter sp. 8L]